jgi:hypothetical protein
VWGVTTAQKDDRDSQARCTAHSLTMGGEEAGKRAAALELGTRYKNEGNEYFKQKHMLAAMDRWVDAMACMSCICETRRVQCLDVVRR